jgi:hypothetical protein
MKKIILLALPAMLCLHASVIAQKVPVAFDTYHGFTGTENYLKSVARAYPDITRLEVIGESNFNRPVYVLTVTNLKTGTPLDRFVPLRNPRKEGVRNVPAMTNDLAKPGQWICGATHGNEYTGTEVCLYIIDKLVSGYGSDPEITDLVDANAFYICPMVNPDGVYNSVEKDFSQRGNSMLKDDDGDGRINEDGYDDLDGDGRITWFRYRDPEGKYITDEVDPRIMIRLREGEKTSRERWSLIREDKDNDGDGKRGEDGEQGFDLNRNYPEGWFDENGYQGGTGDYPTSAPEVRAMAEFFSNHHNILMAQFYHTSGGFTYRPMGVSSDESMQPKDIAVYDLILGKKYAEIMGDDIPRAWMYPDSMDSFRQELKDKKASRYAIARGYEMPRTWVVSWNEKEDKRYGFGLQADWAYQEMGILALTTELFNYRYDLPGYTFTGKDAYTQFQRAALKYQAEKAGGKWFREWKPFRHPELGEGEIGGWYPQYMSNAFPGEILKKICETHWQYEKYRAGLLPHVVITRAAAKVLEKSGPYRIVEVTARVENKGQLATNLARGAELPGNRPDVVWLTGDRGKLTFLQGTAWQKAGVLGGTLKLPGFRPDKKWAEVKWIVKVEGNTPLKVVSSSLKGGTDVMDVVYNQEEKK